MRKGRQDTIRFRQPAADHLKSIFVAFSGVVEPRAVDKDDIASVYFII